VAFGAPTHQRLGLVHEGLSLVRSSRKTRSIRAAALAVTSDGLWTLDPQSSTLTLLEAR
jgi:hypothetical protein